MKKTCFKCERSLPLSSFYRHAAMADGHLNKCKECAKRDVRENRKKKIDQYREYDRERGSRQSPENQREYRSRYPKKARALRMVAYHVRKGTLRPEPCEKCGKENTHAHHDDYDYPLNVRWLCAEHHREWHDRNGEGANGS